MNSEIQELIVQLKSIISSYPVLIILFAMVLYSLAKRLVKMALFAGIALVIACFAGVIQPPL